METLENMLFEAAAEGNVNSLRKLLQEDPIILDRAIVNSFSDTPIHVAAILGHRDFVKEILRRRPESARELNSGLSSPLHLASAKGYIEVVRVLLSANPLMCLARDRNGLTPLHLAAIKGRTEVVKELVQAKRDAARVIVGQGQTILHLCVKYHQIEALKLLVNAIGDKDFTNCKDSDGNTILHLAVADKQVETVKFLLMESAMDVKAQNLRGMTAMDVLIQGRRDVRDEEIEESLKRAGAIGSIENNSTVQINSNITSPGMNFSFEHPDLSSKMKKKGSKKFRQKDWLEKKQSAIMVVASLIATMAFQVGVNPPSGVWQDTKPDVSQCTPAPAPAPAPQSQAPPAPAPAPQSQAPPAPAPAPQSQATPAPAPQSQATPAPAPQSQGTPAPAPQFQVTSAVSVPQSHETGGSFFTHIRRTVYGKFKIDNTTVPQSHEAGESIFSDNHPIVYGSFLIANTTGLIASLSIILLLMSGLPLRRRIFVGILRVVTWIAITAVALTYLLSIIILTPEKEREKQIILLVVGSAVVIWLGLVVLLLIGHTIRLIIKIIRPIIKMVRKLIKRLISKQRIGHSGITSHRTV